jgi:replicative superfamily II helicase
MCALLGIPEDIKFSYENKGLKHLYQWQAECLTTTGVLDGKNLVYCAPTGGGKTLVAELAMLKTVIGANRKAIFVLPFVSLVIEKERELKNILRKWNKSRTKSNKIRVGAHYGDSGGVKITENIIICTIEKANGIVNSFIVSGKAWQLGCIVIDEMHVLGDAQRGFHLEILVR